MTKFCTDGTYNNMFISSAFYTLVVILVSCLFVGLLNDALKSSQCITSNRCDKWWMRGAVVEECQVLHHYLSGETTTLWISLVGLAGVWTKIYPGTSGIWCQITALFMNLKNDVFSCSPVYEMWLFSRKICWHVRFMPSLLSLWSFLYICTDLFFLLDDCFRMI